MSPFVILLWLGENTLQFQKSYLNKQHSNSNKHGERPQLCVLDGLQSCIPNISVFGNADKASLHPLSDVFRISAQEVDVDLFVLSSVWILKMFVFACFAHSSETWIAVKLAFLCHTLKSADLPLHYKNVQTHAN